MVKWLNGELIINFYNIMDTFLDIQALVDERRKHENIRLMTFKSILKKCYDTIKRYNKEKIYEMDYKIPTYLIGAPRYDFEILKNYLIHHLTENGLKVMMLDDGYTIYISWKETDINLEKYLNKKKTAEKDLCMKADGFPIETVQTNTVSPSTMKFRQEKQLQLQKERQERLLFQKNRFT